MTTDAPRWAAVVFLMAAQSCGAGGPPRSAAAMLAETRPMPPPIESACALAGQRCTRCHTIDRVLLARVESPEHWQYYVDRMRRQPLSGITPDDGQVIVRCLVYRSFGAAGLEALHNDSRRPDEE